MLRSLLLVLVAANLLFFAFTRGWFDGVMGLSSRGDREPERIAAQVRPETIRVLPPDIAASAVAAGSSCYEAGPFSAADALGAEAALRSALPPGSWTDVRAESLSGTGIGAGASAVTHTYRVADASLATRLAGVRLDASGRGFTPCGTAAPPPR